MTRILSVLYVDDESDLLEIGKLFLEQSGEYAIDTSISAADALTRLEQKKYDAIISDYQMPLMDGIKFLQVLRNRGDTIPFIIFTGRGREEVILEALNSGVDFYLQKGGEPKAQFAELQNIVGKAVRQKSADEALKESEAKYRSILENIQDVYYRSDADSNLILASPSIATVLGYDSLSELYGKDIAQTLYYLPEQRTQILADINQTGSVTNYEVTLKKRDGTPVFALTSSHKYYDQSGNCLGVEGILRDITERKKAEDELRAAYEQITASEEELRAQFDELKYGQDALCTSEKKLQGIVQGSPIPQFVIDKNHLVISWNNALERYSRVKADEVLGTNLQWKAFYPEERPCMADLLVDGSIEKIPQWYLGKYNKSKYIEGAYEATDFFPRMGTNGIWLYFTASTIKDSQGNIIGAVETLEDITDIKVKEDALRASEEQYRSLVDNLTVGVYRNTAGSPGRWIWANPAFVKIFGYESLDECLSHPVTDLYFSPEDRKPLLQALDTDGFVRNFELYLKKKDGTPIWISLNSRVKRNAEGRIEWIDGICEDITERKQMELSLKRSEEQFRNVVETQTEFICRFKPDGTHVFVNEAYCRYFGKNCSELIGKKFKPEIPPDDQASIREHFASLTHDHPVATINHRIIMPDGSLRWQRWVDRAIFNEQGILTEYQTVGRDITDIKQAEQALIDSENKLSTIVRGSPIPQFVIDRDHQVIQWNKALEVYSRISAKEVLGTNQQWRAFYPSERPCMADLLVDGEIEKIPQWYSGKYRKSELIDDAYEATDFFPHMGPSGTWLHFTAAPIRNEKGEILGAVETLEDVTDIKQAEKVLARKVEELARSNTELEQFAHIASHDLQQPLRRIASYLQLIEQRYKGRLDSDADEFIGYAVDGAKELQIMINGLLDFSHVQT
ncbi:MAG: PAS domain S-box protein, partial [Methanoregula sp.]|nr:PAS domain S-box protein [Methanoregula sp.]